MEAKVLRWKRKEDARRVASIRSRCGMDPGLLDEVLHDSFGICKVVELDGKIVGFLAYRNGRRKIRLVEVAVHPSFRRRGVALFLLNSMSARMELDPKRVEALVSEYNLPAQMLMKKAGFMAVETVTSPSGSDYRFIMAPKVAQKSDILSESPKVVEN